jgi:hypothetical protein
MRMMFVYWKVENAGSAQTIYNFASTARKFGHEVVLYAPEGAVSRFQCSLDIESADVAIFVLEWNIYLHNNEPLDLEGPIARMPRNRRIVIDNDGMYDDVIEIGGDCNHLDKAASRNRVDLYDSIADKICQPTLHPRPRNVRSFLFHGYNPAWEVPLDFRAKEFGMCYVGSNWFRWKALKRVLQAIEPIRDRVGRVGLVGHDWGQIPWWIEQPLRERAYMTDPEYLRSLDIEIMPAVPIEHVIGSMSKAVFNPVLARPLFNHLRLTHPRLFETLAANTIPLFNLGRDHVVEIYGEPAGELVFGENASEQILDVLGRPDYYAEIVREIREHLAVNHSFERRFQELIDIIDE